MGIDTGVTVAKKDNKDALFTVVSVNADGTITMHDNDDKRRKVLVAFQTIVDKYIVNAKKEVMHIYIIPHKLKHMFSFSTVHN
jgi:hypothetical protein